MMRPPKYTEIIKNGLWTNNAGLVMLLGLCPLLAVSTTVVNALGLGLATAIVMTFSNGAVSLIRNLVPHEVRIPVFILIIAVLVTIIQLVMNAFMQPLYVVLGIFVPLIVVNCNVLGRAESFASKNTLWPSVVDGLMVGLGLTLTLAALGALREILGKGTLLSGISLAFGKSANHWVITLFPHYPGFLLAILPPGAFLGLGFLIAAKNYADHRFSAPRHRQTKKMLTSGTAS